MALYEHMTVLYAAGEGLQTPVCYRNLMAAMILLHLKV